MTNSFGHKLSTFFQTLKSDLLKHALFLSNQLLLIFLFFCNGKKKVSWQKKRFSYIDEGILKKN